MALELISSCPPSDVHISCEGDNVRDGTTDYSGTENAGGSTDNARSSTDHVIDGTVNAGGSTDNVNGGTTNVSDGTTLSKNQLRKRRFHERKLAARRAARAEEHRRRRRRDKEKIQQAISDGVELVYGRQLRQQQIERLTAANNSDSVLNICIDLQYATSPPQCDVTDKQLTRLSQQLTRIYGANRAAHHPTRLHITSCPSQSPFYQLCCDKTRGFDAFLWHRSSSAVERLFDHARLVFLSPEADEELRSVRAQDVYVIGGIVDETVSAGLSLSRAAGCGVRTARLPLSVLATEERQNEEGRAAENEGESARAVSCVLTVNQVFEVLLAVYNGQDWNTALRAVIPHRKLTRMAR